MERDKVKKDIIIDKIVIDLGSHRVNKHPAMYAMIHMVECGDAVYDSLIECIKTLADQLSYANKTVTDMAAAMRPMPVMVKTEPPEATPDPGSGEEHPPRKGGK